MGFEQLRRWSCHRSARTRMRVDIIERTTGALNGVKRQVVYTRDKTHSSMTSRVHQLPRVRRICFVQQQYALLPALFSRRPQTFTVVTILFVCCFPPPPSPPSLSIFPFRTIFLSEHLNAEKKKEKKRIRITCIKHGLLLSLADVRTLDVRRLFESYYEYI